MTSSTQKNERLTPLVEGLCAHGKLRVWSVIVTAFGDLAGGPHDQISSRCLSRLTRPIGLKPEAVRVALFRLKNDGWITSRKLGRESHYRLSDHGFSETRAARGRIYGSGPRDREIWRLCLAPPHDTQSPKGMARLSPRVFLDETGDGAPPKNWLCLRGSLGAVPDWLSEELAPDGVAEALCALNSALLTVARSSDGGHGFTAHQIAIVRILIVHHWRRIVLRLPDLPDRFFPEAWHLGTCRARVETLLQAFPRPSLRDLESFHNNTL